ncbi:hypothetical protein [Shewanella salipaludis]|uniref:Uncharacterized protein n=1 Tax=Shewanella salipaludis TaxID=2723052 RepID=A0A972FRD8_9GAMM|nr:hypothetical protein [Shewanella salipaludis]NMH64347.1 hypothetical protein [Shewanella salipaludis]
MDLIDGLKAFVATAQTELLAVNQALPCHFEWTLQYPPMKDRYFCKPLFPVAARSGPLQAALSRYISA